MSTTSCDVEAASRYPALSVGSVNCVLKTTHTGATQEYAGDDMGAMAARLGTMWGNSRHAYDGL